MITFVVQLEMLQLKWLGSILNYKVKQTPRGDSSPKLKTSGFSLRKDYKFAQWIGKGKDKNKKGEIDLLPNRIRGRVNE